MPQVKEVKEKVRHDIGAIASLAGATVVEQLPKTRSGKVRTVKSVRIPARPPGMRHGALYTRPFVSMFVIETIDNSDRCY